MMRLTVLDEGYVEFIEAWGTGLSGVPSGDEALSLPDNPPDTWDYERGIIEAARQSTQGNFRGWDEDRKLLAHLYNNNHATPFEFAGMIIEVKAPIMVFREWHRHRTQSYNESSARYAPLPALDYLPTIDRLMTPPSNTNKQAGSVGGRQLLEDDALVWLDLLADHYKRAEDLYQRGLRYGVPKELARLPMPVGHYSQMRAQATLRNWLAFLTLRMDPAAQWEIRQFANAVGAIIAEKFPYTYKLFDKRK